MKFKQHEPYQISFRHSYEDLEHTYTEEHFENMSWSQYFQTISTVTGMCIFSDATVVILALTRSKKPGNILRQYSSCVCIPKQTIISACRLKLGKEKYAN